jgi:hypothetical protein
MHITTYIKKYLTITLKKKIEELNKRIYLEKNIRPSYI